MKTNSIKTCIAAVLLILGASPIPAMAERGMPGGFAEAKVDSEEVKAAAAFAVKAQEKAVQPKDGEAAKLELVCILKAEQQVVAGMNYRLKLKVKQNGAEKTAEAVVWWQAWRKPEPYQLTSWEWK